MKENHKVTVGISPTNDVLKPQCSCSECDSVSCFSKRQPDEHSCGVCKDSKSCLLLAKNKSGSVNFGDNKTELTVENITRELVKKEIVYEIDKNNQLRIISKKKSKLFYEAVDQRYIKDKNDLPTRVHSAIVAGSHKKAGPSAGELSAQIMDVPYNDFQKSVSKPNFPSTLPNLSPFDIINRIKEAYKACSCKVCECIVGKSLLNDHCKCKPCECNDCANFTRNVKSFTESKRLLCPKDNDGCPCIRCDRDSCKGIGENKGSRTQIMCDCVGMLQCDYPNRNDYSHDCNCEPCQCIECNQKYIHRRRTMIVAPVGEDLQRRVCECTPCECFNCGQGYGPPSNQHNEVSTSMNRHPQCHCEMCLDEACIPDDNLICRCERQSKVMSKPFQQDSHDYDIRRAAVIYDEKHKHGVDNHCDTITMFAAIANTYPKRETNKKRCDCNQCECLVCKYKEKPKNSSKLFRPIQNYELKTKKNNCKCSICDCQYCTQHSDINKSKVCGCDVCDCIICNGFGSSNVELNDYDTKKVKTEFTSKQDCRCDPCECVECKKLMSDCVGDIFLGSNSKYENGVKQIYSDEVIYPVKRGEKLTPSIYRSKLKDSFIESCISTLESNEGILKHPLAFTSLNKPTAIRSVQEEKDQDDSDVFYRKYFQGNESNHHMADNFHNRTETVKHAQISKCANLINLHSRNIEPVLESNFSAHSSITFPRDSGSIAPSKCKLKSWESSCNSSGHDYPSYLIHFPKATVDTYLNDIMHYDTENDLNFTTLNCSKNNVRRQKNKDLNANFRIQPKGPSIRTVFSYENPTTDMNSQSQIHERNDFKYSAQNFENHPYRLQNLKTSHNMVIPPNCLPMTKVLSPTDVNIQSQTQKRNNFKYSAKSFDERSNRPQNFKTSPNNMVSKSIEKESTSVAKDGYPIRYEKYPSPSKKNNLNSIDEDYKRAQKTLQEARAFSLQLLRLLEKYETANKNFESVSEKIKNTEVSIPTKNTPRHSNCKENLIDSFDINEVPTKEQPQKLFDSSKEQSAASNTNAKGYDKIQLSKGLEYVSENKANASKYSGSIAESEICNENNEGRDESGDNINKIDEFLNTITEEKEAADVSHKQVKKRRVATKLHRSFNKLYKRSIGPNREKSFTNSSNVEVDATVGTKTNNNQVLKVEAIEQIKNKITDQENTNGNFSEAKSLQINKKVDALKKSTTELRVSVTEKYTEDHHIFHKDVIMIKQPMAEDSRNTVEINSEEPWPILKKNFCLDNAKVHERRFPIWTELEKDVKTATKAIAKQHTYENATYLYENKALTKLHSEVKKLLNMPILKTVKNTTTPQKDNKDAKVIFHNCSLKTSSSQTYKVRGKEDGHNLQKNVEMSATVSRNSCDAMKVNYLNVRRVSDHTVLVKWNTPRMLDNVVGYELLVDGRAVQKILSPSRRVAVVTCLPHHDKVILTVRTVVRSPCCDHSPAVTIIYQPKVL